MTEQNYLEAELNKLVRENDQIWQFLQRGSLDGVWYWDLENPENEWISAEFWQLFGIDPATKEHSSAEWQEIIFPEDLAAAVENFEAHCADPAHPYDQIVRYYHADGSVVWVRCRGIAVRTDDGKPIRLLGAHTDLTATKRAEKEALAAKARAEEVNEELRAFACGASHDLKSPVNTIQMLLEEVQIADTGGLNEDQRALLAMAQRTSSQMLALVEGLLDYARLIGEQQQIEIVPLGEIVASVQELLGAEICAAGAKIDVGPLPKLAVHRAQFHALFQNLISNAIRYCAAGVTPEIRIFAEDNPDAVRLTVADNGIGIAKANHERVFGLFNRLHRATEYAGSGIGLALCRRIVQNHGGEICLRSDEGAGCEFTVTIPLAGAAACGASAASQEELAA